MKEVNSKRYHPYLIYILPCNAEKAYLLIAKNFACMESPNKIWLYKHPLEGKSSLAMRKNSLSYQLVLLQVSSDASLHLSLTLLDMARTCPSVSTVNSNSTLSAKLLYHLKHKNVFIKTQLSLTSLYFALSSLLIVHSWKRPTVNRNGPCRSQKSEMQCRSPI